MNYIPVLLFSLGATLLIGCGNALNKTMKPMENIRTPKADYSYAVKPEFKSSKEELELKVKGLFEAEKVRVSVATYHRYDNETLEQINEDFWVHLVILNSLTININDEKDIQAEGRRIAQLVMEEIQNKESYDKIQITFLKQWLEGEELRENKYSEFFEYPSFKKTSRFE